MRLRAKTDANQADIVQALRAAGVSVLSLAPIGNGVPDLLCSYRGYVTLLEVKMPKQKLRPAQVRWHANWDSYCPIFVVETIGDALIVTRERWDALPASVRGPHHPRP